MFKWSDTTTNPCSQSSTREHLTGFQKMSLDSHRNMYLITAFCTVWIKSANRVSSMMNFWTNSNMRNFIRLHQYYLKLYCFIFLRLIVYDNLRNRAHFSLIDNSVFIYLFLTYFNDFDTSTLGLGLEKSAGQKSAGISLELNIFRAFPVYNSI